jgi:transposase
VPWHSGTPPPLALRHHMEDSHRTINTRPPTQLGRVEPDIAVDFGISESCLNRWLKAADVEDGIKSGVTSEEPAENRQLRKRVRLLEQENEVLRPAAAHLSQANPPAK